MAGTALAIRVTVFLPTFRARWQATSKRREVVTAKKEKVSENRGPRQGTRAEYFGE